MNFLIPSRIPVLGSGNFILLLFFGFSESLSLSLLSFFSATFLCLSSLASFSFSSLFSVTRSFLSTSFFLVNIFAISSTLFDILIKDFSIVVLSTSLPVTLRDLISRKRFKKEFTFVRDSGLELSSPVSPVILESLILHYPQSFKFSGRYE